MKTATQSSSLPTRKLAVAMAVGPAVTALWKAVMTDLYAPLSGTEVTALIGALASFAVAYWVKDAPNIPDEEGA